MNRNDSKQDERHQGASQEAIRPHDRPEGNADLPSWHAIADLCIADTEALAITARDRLEAVTAHARLLCIHATRAATVVMALENALRMADSHLACEESIGFKDERDSDPLGKLGEEMFLNIKFALEHAQALSRGWSLRLEAAGMRRKGLQRRIATCDANSVHVEGHCFGAALSRRGHT